MPYLRNQFQSEENLNEENRNRKKFQTNNTQNDTNANNTDSSGRLQRSAENFSVTAEDIQLLQECSRESFWSRSVPLSCAVCALMFGAAKYKNQKPKLFHIVSGTFLGWMVGKWSYKRTCEDKIINSGSNSAFAKAVRRRRGVIRELDNNPMASEPTDMSDDYWQSNPSSTTTPDNVFDYSSNEFANYKEENFQQKGDNEDLNRFTTYDDLRAKNRSNYKPHNNPRPFSQ